MLGAEIVMCHLGGCACETPPRSRAAWLRSRVHAGRLTAHSGKIQATPDKAGRQAPQPLGGEVVLLIGVILAVLGMVGHAVGGRRHHY